MSRAHSGSATAAKRRRLLSIARLDVRWSAVFLLLLALAVGAPARADDVQAAWDDIVFLREPVRPPKHAPLRRKKRGEGREAGWHGPADPALVELAARYERAPLILLPVGEREPYVLEISDDEGTLSDSARELADRAFGVGVGEPSIHPRLLGLIYRATQHFDVPYVHLVSGLRDGRDGSRHTHGLAADIVLPTVTNEALAAFFRAQGFVGVGVYPRSGFVHIDVRDQSYFWIDRSAPGHRSRIVPVRGDEARHMDREALARGQHPFVNPPELAAALDDRAAKRRRPPRSKRMAKKPNS